MFLLQDLINPKMARSKAISKAKKRSRQAVEHPVREDKAPKHPGRHMARARPGPKNEAACDTIRLICLLPKVGFAWGHIGLRPDLRQEHVWAIQDAFLAAHGQKNRMRTFDEDMATIITRGLELEESVTDTNPEDFWAKVKATFHETGSLVEHPALTPQILHAFIAYAVEAREHDIKDNPNAELNLTKAIDELMGEFACEPHSEMLDQYLHRPEEARWLLQDKEEEKKEVEEEEKGEAAEKEDKANDGDHMALDKADEMELDEDEELAKTYANSDSMFVLPFRARV